jgi:flagellar protein FliO/FliZ
MLLFLAQAASVPLGADSAGSVAWLVFRMIVVLVAVIIVAILVLKYVAPTLGSFANARFKGEYIEILARRSLDPKKHLWVIKVGARHFLVGSADGGVNCIAELDAKDVEGG